MSSRTDPHPGHAPATERRRSERLAYEAGYQQALREVEEALRERQDDPWEPQRFSGRWLNTTWSVAADFIRDRFRAGSERRG